MFRKLSVRLWHRLARFWDGLFVLGEKIAASTSRGLNFGLSSRTPATHKRRQTQLELESLESRRLMTIYPQVSFADSSLALVEGGSVSESIDINPTNTLALSVDYDTSDGTALAGTNYTAASGTLSVPAGQSSWGTITVNTIDTGTNGADKLFDINLTNPVNATVGTPNVLPVTIENDHPITVQFSSATYSVSSQASSATITATLSGESDQDVYVDYATSAGTAVPGTDYTNVSGTLTFPAYATSETFTVPIISHTNTYVDPDRTVNLTLSNPTTSVAEGSLSGFSLGTQNTATLTITNVASLSTKVSVETAPTLTVPLDGCGCSANFPDLALQYSPSASVQPIIETMVASDPSGPMPTGFTVTLTWNGTAGTPVYFDTTGHSAGDVYALGMQVPSVVTSSGDYSYSVEVTTSWPSDPDTTTTVSGTTAVVATGSTPDGYGWSLTNYHTLPSSGPQAPAPAASSDPLAPAQWTDALPGGDQLLTVSGGVLWTTSQGAAAFFTGPDGSGDFTSPANALGTLVQNSDGSYTYTLTNQTQKQFSSSGQLTSVVDPNGQTTTFTYSDGELSTITAPGGQVVTFGYDGSGLLQTITQPGGAVITLTHSSGDLTGIDFPNTTSRDFTYLTGHRLATDSQGVTYSYDPTSLFLTEIDYGDGNTLDVTSGASKSLQTDPAINAADAVDSVTDALDNVTNFSTNAQGLITQLVAADGSTQSWTYNDAGQVTSYTNQLSQITTYSYDTSGNLSQVTNPDGSTQQYQYDPTFNKPTVSIDALGNRTTNTYDPSTGNLLTTTDPLGGVTTYTYNADGLQQTVTNPLGETTTYLYNAAQQVQTVIDPLGDRTTTLYDGAGNTTAVIDPNGNETQYLYDADGNQTVTIDQLGNRTTTLYDARGNATETIDPNGNETQYLFNAAGQQTVTIDPLGNRTTSLFDAAGNTTAVINANGNETQYLYNADGRQTVVIDPLGNRTTTLFDAAGQTTAVINANGNETEYLYDAAGRQSVTIDPLGNRTTTLFDAAGHTTGVIDANGNETEYLFDAAGRQSVVIDPLGNRATTLFDAAGQTTGVIDANGNETEYLYDAAGRQTVTIDALGNRTTTLFDAAGQATAVINANGNETEYLYDADGHQSVTIDPLGNRTTTLFDAAGQTTAVIDANGHETQYLYDADGRQSVTIDPLGNRTTTLFDAAGQTTAVIDANGHETDYLYDAAGRQSVVIDPLGNRTTTLFDAVGQTTAVIDANGNETDYLSDADGRQTVTIDPLGNRTTTLYDAAGQTTAVINANGNETQYLYNAAGRQTVTIDPLGNRTTALYDAAGNATAVFDANGNESQFLFDADERQSVTIDPLGNRTTTLFDAAGQTTAMIDARSNETQYVLDADGRQTVKIDALSHRTTMLYDAVGNMTALIDPDSNETKYTFDADNRQATETDPLNNVTTTTYDAVGHVSSVIDRNGREDVYTYDDDGRLVGETWLASVGGTVEDRLTYTYDSVGHMLTASNSSGTNTFTYDANGRVTEEDEPFGVTLNYTYDAVGNRTSLSDSFGGVTSYLYDADNRVTSTTFSGTGETPFRVDQTWTAMGQLASVKRYSDLDGTDLVSETDYTYDDAGNVTDIQTKDSSGTVIDDYSYTYESGNLLIAQDINGTITSYAYDADDELTSANTTIYSYDANGNFTMTGYSTGTGNQLLSDGTWTYSYDAAGNMTEKTLGTGLETWYYYYNNQNHLTEVVETSDGSTEVMTETYSYDALGNQIKQVVWQSGVGTTTTEQVYDDQTLLMDLDGSGDLQTRYFAGNGPDQWVARQDASGNTYYYLTDNLGSVVGIVSASGSLVDSISYDAFGNVTGQTDSALTGNIQYAGMWMDPETGLNRTPNREYAAPMARWIQEDPIQFQAGDADLYRYVGNDYTNATDPSGLKDDTVPEFIARMGREEGWKLDSAEPSNTQFFTTSYEQGVLGKLTGTYKEVIQLVTRYWVVVGNEFWVGPNTKTTVKLGFDTTVTDEMSFKLSGIPVKAITIEFSKTKGKVTTAGGGYDVPIDNGATEERLVVGAQYVFATTAAARNGDAATAKANPLVVQSGAKPVFQGYTKRFAFFVLVRPAKKKGCP